MAVTSQFLAGHVIENALKRAGMLALQRWNLMESDLLHILHQSVLDVAKINFELHKEDFYETRTTLGSTNGKFSQGVFTYDASTQRLSLSGTLYPAANDFDVNKVVTFFDAASYPNKFYAGIIKAFINSSPPAYEIVPFFDIPSLQLIINITVGDWLPTGDVIYLTGENQILSPENLVLYDLANKDVIDIVDYVVFQRRLELDLWRNSDARWATYHKTVIRLAQGIKAPPIGTILISAYWIPHRAGDFNSPLFISDDLVPQVEERMVLKLMAIKTKQIVPEPSVVAAEIQEVPLADIRTKIERERVR